LKAFDSAFWGHIGHIVRNSFRAFLLSLTRGYLAGSPVGGATAKYYRRLAWSSASFAILADIAMGALGGSLKFREKITGRFADILAYMYFSCAVLKRFEAEGQLALLPTRERMAAQADQIPGAQDWPRFTTNQSERFEARLSLVEVLDSPSLFLQGMAGSRMPIAVSHGEGFANFAARGQAQEALAAMRFVNHQGQATEAYPFNPNGSPDGLTAVTTPDGRFTAMMPHPERVFRNIQMSWTSGNIQEHSPWMQLWHNARRWVG
jgi:hypothetical protein